MSEVSFKMVAGVVAGLVSIATIGWTGNQLFQERPTHEMVAGSLEDERWLRYEEEIEQLQEENVELEFVNRPLTVKEMKQIELNQNRIQKYQKKQERIDSKK